eukprot:Nitzschia sp. Nitz4//scaffold67_size101165//23799//25178//NITZ4_004523-RA/size101165-processed-gene-0.113-mRNA-1//-1//CDS//3329556456//4868//frame0
MELFTQTIQFHPRKTLFAKDVDSWPVAKRHQYYTLAMGSLLLGRAGEVFEAIKKRPDVNGLEIELKDLIRNKMNFQFLVDVLLETNDRSWSVFLKWSDSFVPSSPVSLMRALEVLRKTKYLSLDYGENRYAILDHLPRFEKLECLDLRKWLFSEHDHEILNQYPFIHVLYGLGFYDNYGVSRDKISSFSTSNIMMAHAEIGRSTSYQAAVILASLAALRYLDILHLSILPNEDLEDCISQLETFFSPESPVNDLTLEFEHAEQVQSILYAAPNETIPKTVRLYIRDCDVDLGELFDVISEYPCINKITFMDFGFGEDSYREILEFQLKSRPLLFPIQLLRNVDKPKEGAMAEKIHQVSAIFETIQNLSQTEMNTAFPLAARAILLEKMCSAVDSSCPSVRAVGLDATFSEIHRLLGKPIPVVRWDFHDGGLGLSPTMASPEVSRSTRNAVSKNKRLRLH